MSKFDPAKLSVTIFPPATPYKPVDERKYTLTHIDTTGELFLTIGYCYDYQAINEKFRDEVLAEWKPRMGQYTLIGKVYVSNGEFDEKYAMVRYLIFQRELPLALTAIVYGDQALYQNHPWLLDAPIYIQFESSYTQFQQFVYYGTPRQYLTTANKERYPNRTHAQLD